MRDASPEMMSVFCAALERISPEERAAYVQAACGEDKELRLRIEALLCAHEQAGGIVAERKDDEAARPTGAPSNSDLMSTTIGPYKLLQQIGEGGMGSVWMAEQTHPVQRKVALKLIKTGIDSRQVIARFEAERQALALMDHPNIAKVLDAGSTIGGQPYCVMELIKGTPITKYCDEHQLTFRERLALFIPVCQAVQHAHQKGIIHRDLKPSNVLVCLYDGKPVPKVIDFGVVKATGQKLTDKTLFTDFGSVIGTLEYMSPEQAELNQLDIDTRSDIYSLGVLLYELLTGTTPLQRNRLINVAFLECLRVIREEEPPKPSTRLTNSKDTLASVAALRQTEPSRLTREVRGELDWIVMKCLEKNRGRRYETANGLARDVEHYLNDDAVEACPPSTGYRLKKFAWRHRSGLATVGILAITLVTATVVSVWQAVRARDAQRKAESAEQGERTKSAIASALNDFLQKDVLEQAQNGPEAIQDADGNPDLTVREALDRAAAKIEGRFRDQPLVEAAIQASIGTAYLGIYQYRVGVPHLEQALIIRELNLGPDQQETIQTTWLLAEAYSWVAQHEKAIALLQRTLEREEEHLGPDAPETLVTMGRLAGALDFADQKDAKMKTLQTLFEKRCYINGSAHPKTLSALHQLAMHYGLAGKFAESFELYEKLFRLYRQSPAAKPEQRIWWTLTYGRANQLAGKLDQAERLFRDALELNQSRKPGFIKQQSKANALGWLALNAVLQEQYTSAEPLAREALAIHPFKSGRYFYYMGVLGGALLGQKKYPEAERMLLDGYHGLRQSANVHPIWKNHMNEVGEWAIRLYEATGRKDKAAAFRVTMHAPPGPGPIPKP